MVDVIGHEAAGHVVGVVLDQRGFDDEVDFPLGQADAGFVADLARQALGHGAGDIGDKAAILLSKDFLLLLLAGEHEVGQGITDDLGHLGYVEVPLLAAGLDLDSGLLDRGVGHNLAPVEARLLFGRGGRIALEGEVFVKGEVTNHKAILS